MSGDKAVLEGAEDEALRQLDISVHALDVALRIFYALGAANKNVDQLRMIRQRLSDLNEGYSREILEWRYRGGMKRE